MSAIRELREHDGFGHPLAPHVFACSHVGVATTTNPWTRYAGGLRGQEGLYEARVGFTMMGETWGGLGGCPFDDKYRGNYARAFGPTPEDARAALHAELAGLSEVIFA